MSQLISALGWALLQSLWQTSVIALLLVIALPFLRRAAQRYRAACAALASLPLIFIWSVAGRYGSIPSTPMDRFVPASQAQPFGVFNTEALFLVGRQLEPLLPVVVILWLLGVIIYSALLAGGWCQLRRVRRSAGTVSLLWQARFRDLAQRLGVSDSVVLRKSPLVSVPTVIGLFKPIVLIPVSVMSSLTPAQLEAILIHELLHIRRYDPLVNALQIIIETFFFYHPVVRWLSNVMRQEREYCCDDAVVKLTGDALFYAKALNELETLRSSPPKLVLAASGGQFMNRIHRLVQPQRTTYQPLRPILVILLLAGLLAACTSDSLRTATSNTPSNEVGTYCFQSISVRAGNHEMPAFNDASLRAMKKALTERGYGVNCEDADAALNLDYEMVFDARALSWQAWMLVSDGQGQVLELATANDAIDKNGAFQYTTENTAQSLLGQLLDN